MKKKDDLRWLKDAIKDYLQNRGGQNTNTLDIQAHFKLIADVIMKSLHEMVEDSEIIRVNFFAEGWDGHHTYKLPPGEKPC